MNNRLYELINRKYLKDVRYLPKNRYLIADIQNKDVVIRFFNSDCHRILITAKTDNEQNREIYNIIKNDLLDIHEPYQEFVEVTEDNKKNGENIYSFFAIGTKMYSAHQEAYDAQKEYMDYLLDIVFDFDENMLMKALQAIKENKNIYIILNDEGVEKNE